MPDEERTLGDVAHDVEELRRREEALDTHMDRVRDALDAIDDLRGEDSELIDAELQGALSAARSILQFEVIRALDEQHHGIYHERECLRRERWELEHEQEGGDD